MSEKESVNEEKAEQTIEDASIFRKLLSLKDEVHEVRVIVPILDEPLYVHYMILKEGDKKNIDIGAPKTKEEFESMDKEQKFEMFLKAEEELVWQMIDKAQKYKTEKGKFVVDKKYRITRKMWDEMGTDMPDIRREIVGAISGSSKQMTERFFGGPKNRRL